jgi:transcriptional regulator with XRE-family HTH domain
MAKQRELSAAERAVMDRVEEAMQRKVWSWAELARRVGLSDNAGSQWSGRRAFPRQRTMIRLAEVLEVSQSWLLKGDEPDAQLRPLTARQAEILKLMQDMGPDAEAAALASIRGIAAHMAKNK